MILIDTSVWVAHFRGADTPLAAGPVPGTQWLLHPFVLGELALGGLPKDRELLQQLARLRPADLAEPAEVTAFIQWGELAGTGVGYVDAHLLVSARLMSGSLMTRDKHLLAQAIRFGLAYES